MEKHLKIFSSTARQLSLENTSNKGHITNIEILSRKFVFLFYFCSNDSIRDKFRNFHGSLRSMWPDAAIMSPFTFCAYFVYRKHDFRGPTDDETDFDHRIQRVLSESTTTGLSRLKGKLFTRFTIARENRRGLTNNLSQRPLFRFCATADASQIVSIPSPTNWNKLQLPLDRSSLNATWC